MEDTACTGTSTIHVSSSASNAESDFEHALDEKLSKRQRKGLNTSTLGAPPTSSTLSISEIFKLCDGEKPDKLKYDEFSKHDGAYTKESEAYREKYHARNTELRDECRSRGLSTDGNKQELRNRLIASMPYWKERVASLQDKPLILLDIDGVINERFGGDKDGRVEVYVKNFAVSYSPLIIEAINRWDSTNMAEIRWLTSWNETAQDEFAPAVGLNYFALARDNTHAQARSFCFPVISKAKAACDCLSQTPTRRLVWIDDEVNVYAKENNFKIRPNTLLVNCDTKHGLKLTLADIKRIDSFLEL